MIRSQITGQMTWGLTLILCGALGVNSLVADPPRSDKEPAGQKPVPAADAPAADKDAPVDKEEAPLLAEDDKGPWEVTDQIELVYREKLSVAGDQALTAKVVLKNQSDLELPGPLMLVIDGTTVGEVELAEPSGRFTEETPYLQFVPAKRTLDAGDESAARVLTFKTTEKTDELKLEEAELHWRVFTTTKPTDQEDEIASDEKVVPGKGYTWGELRKVMAVQSAATVDMMEKHSGSVVATGTSEDENGRLVMRVFAARGGMARKLPGNVDGVPVEVSVVGTFRAGPAYSRVTYENGVAQKPEKLAPIPESTDGDASPKVAEAFAAQVGKPTDRYVRPVPIGVSISNHTDGCVAGTLGCRVIGRDKKIYILSNNHVLADNNVAPLASAIGQPGLADNSCTVVGADPIAVLRRFETIRYFTQAKNVATAPINIIDAAIAETTIANTDICTPAAGYGTPARTPLEAIAPGLAVMKYGRTSGFTKGKVGSVNVEAVIDVGRPFGFARFQYSISIQPVNRGMTFGAAGDSGSLVVTQSGKRPIGLLYGGATTEILLCPISAVFTKLGVGIDDGTGAAPIMGSGRMGTAVGNGKPPVKLYAPLNGK